MPQGQATIAQFSASLSRTDVCFHPLQTLAFKPDQYREPGTPRLVWGEWGRTPRVSENELSNAGRWRTTPAMTRRDELCIKWLASWKMRRTDWMPRKPLAPTP